MPTDSDANRTEPEVERRPGTPRTPKGRSETERRPTSRNAVPTMPRLPHDRPPRCWPPRRRDFWRQLVGMIVGLGLGRGRRHDCWIAGDPSSLVAVLLQPRTTRGPAVRGLAPIPLPCSQLAAPICPTVALWDGEPVSLVLSAIINADEGP